MVPARVTGRERQKAVLRVVLKPDRLRRRRGECVLAVAVGIVGTIVRNADLIVEGTVSATIRWLGRTKSRKVSDSRGTARRKCAIPRFDDAAIGPKWNEVIPRLGIIPCVKIQSIELIAVVVGDVRDNG